MDAWVATAFPAFGTSMAVTLVAVGLLVVLAACLRAGPSMVRCSPVAARAIAFRERSRDAAYVPLRDPDAPGSRRPRAPGSTPR